MNNHLPALRAKRGWTKVDLADALGVSRQTVHSIEIGKYDPSLPLAFRIAELFDCTIEDVFVAPMASDTDNNVLRRQRS